MARQMTNITQSEAARLAGFIYLLTMATGIFASFYVPSQLYVSGDVAQTASNIIAHETLFRLGIASDLFTFIIDVVLIWALYVLLKPVDKNLALLASFWRVMESAILCMATGNKFVGLQFLSNADHLKAFDPNQSYALAKVALNSYGSDYIAGAICLGLGSTIFSYLLFRSNYIPKALALLGIVSSLFLALGHFAIIIFPEIRGVFPIGYLPIALYEVALGFWLLIKGIKVQQEFSEV